LAESKIATEILSKEKKAELEAKHGEIIAVQTKAGPAAFIGPTRTQYRSHLTKMANDDKNRPQNIEAFVIALCIYPSKEELNEMIERKPGIAPTCYNAILEFAGIEEEKHTKKYETGAEET
jgi:hypothetical protein